MASLATTQYSGPMTMSQDIVRDSQSFTINRDRNGTERVDDSTSDAEDSLDDDDQPSLTQKDILGIISDMAADRNEDALAFAARLEKQLMERSTANQSISLKDARLPRDYKTTKLTTDTLTYLRRVHSSYRVAFGLYLNQDPILPLIKKIFKDFPGSADVKDHAEEVAWSRLRNNCSTWKMKTLAAFETHIRKLCEEDDVFGNCQDITTLHNYLKAKFDPDNWAEIMEPWRKTVNVRGSHRRVYRWSRSLYVDLGARIKLCLDWQSIPAATRPAEAVWDKDAISYRFDTITRSSKYRVIRPSRNDFLMAQPRLSKRQARRAKRQVEVVEPENDPDMFVDSD